MTDPPLLSKPTYRLVYKLNIYFIYYIEAHEIIRSFQSEIKARISISKFFFYFTIRSRYRHYIKKYQWAFSDDKQVHFQTSYFTKQWCTIYVIRSEATLFLHAKNKNKILRNQTRRWFIHELSHIHIRELLHCSVTRDLFLTFEMQE